MGGAILLDMCSKKKSLDTCDGYIGGVVDVLAKDVVFGSRACIPQDGTTVQQLRQIVIAELKKYPEEQGFNAADVIAVAMSKAFPCTSG